MIEIVAGRARTSARRERRNPQQHASQRNEISDQRRAPHVDRLTQHCNRTQQQCKCADGFHNCSWNDAWLMKRPDCNASVLDSAEAEQHRVRCHEQSKKSFHAATSADGSRRVITRGSLNPAAINQTKLGNLTNGMRNSAPGRMRLSQLRSPQLCRNVADGQGSSRGFTRGTGSWEARDEREQRLTAKCLREVIIRGQRNAFIARTQFRLRSLQFSPAWPTPNNTFPSTSAPRLPRLCARHSRSRDKSGECW
jgi:hypothetical protein